MVRKSEIRDRARELRQRGFTLQEIADTCSVAKSTVSGWLRADPDSKETTKLNRSRAERENAKRLGTVQKARARERAKRYQDATRSARTEFTHYQQVPAFRSGLALFLSAGSLDAGGRLRFTHVNPALHRQIIRFLVDFVGVERAKVKLWLHLCAGVDETEAVRHWSKVTKVPIAQFGKSQAQKSTSRRPLHFGSGNTIIASTYHQHKLSEWLQAAEKRW